jgi:hypothetical protein
MFTNSKNHKGSRFFTKRYASKRKRSKVRYWHEKMAEQNLIAASGMPILRQKLI